MTASIGIAVGHGDAESLLADADAAVYRAKAVGGGQLELARRHR
jgi:PleD family two-component response regulator